MTRYLIVANVVVAFVDTTAIRSGVQSGGDILDIGHTINDRADGPVGFTVGDSIIINWGTVRELAKICIIANLLFLAL